MNYELNLITAPTSMPVSLPDMRLYLKANDNVTADDYLIESQTDTAKEMVEFYTRRKLFTQTWDMIFNYGPSTFELPFGQLQSVTSIKVKAEDGSESTQSSDNYYVDTGDTGRGTLKTGNVWTTTTRAYNHFTVRFVCGWTSVNTIPEVYINTIKRIS